MALTNVEHRTLQPWSRLIMYGLLVVLLALGYYANLWQSVSSLTLVRVADDIEGFAFGGLVKARQEGIFAYAGLPGTVINGELPHSYLQWHWQKEAYLGLLPYDHFAPYESQVGLQVMLMAMFDAMTPYPPYTTLELMHMATAMLTAMSVAYVVTWFQYEAGWVAGGLAGAACLFAVPLNLMGQNLFWVPWAFFIPMLACILVAARSSVNTRRSRLLIVAAMWAAVLAKCLLNGYEFITTTLVMMMIPFIYYVVRDRRSWQKALIQAGLIVSGALAGVVTSVAILALQGSLLGGSIAGSMQHLADRFVFRTGGVPESNIGAISTSLGGIIAGYLDQVIFDAKYVPTLRAVHFIVLFLIVTCLYLVLVWKRQPLLAPDSKATSLILATWCSLAAPLSWLALFQQHSIVHILVNNILWYMPFVLFGMAACGRVWELVWIQTRPYQPTPASE